MRRLVHDATNVPTLSFGSRRDRSSFKRPPSDCGMALIAVLWLVAALSIMVASLSAGIRQEAKTLSDKRDVIAAQAIGDAALQLVLQKLRAADRVPDMWTQGTVTYEGHAIVVQVTPLTGLIDPNRADLALLARLLFVAGGLPQSDAAALAQTIIDVRQQRDEKGGLMRFEAPEDLLKVPGIYYDLYARLAPLVTLDGRGSSKVNANAAPAPVLLVLANGDERVVEMIHAKRLSGEVGIDMSGLDAGLIDNAYSPRVNITAIVPLGSGKSVHMSRNVDVMKPTADGTPWSTYSISASIQATTSEN